MKKLPVKKLLLIGSIVMVIVVILGVWAIIAGVGIISKKMPQLTAWVEKVAGGAIDKAQETLPGIQEKAKEVSPEITAGIKGLIPVKDIPEQDVSGEDIQGIPRYPDMVRVSFTLQNGKKIIGYKGKVETKHVIDFYNKEMSALGFKKKVLSASPHEEVHEYRKAKRAIEISFKKIDRFGLVITEMLVKEI